MSGILSVNLLPIVIHMNVLAGIKNIYKHSMTFTEAFISILMVQTFHNKKNHQSYLPII